jgi:hypothetical protein
MRTAVRRLTLGAYVPARTTRWRDWSKLFVVGDDLGWGWDYEPPVENFVAAVREATAR